MSDVLLVFQIILAVILTIIVLLQKSSSIGLGAYGGGSNDSVFGAKGAGGFLTKVTFTIGFLFIVNTVALTYMYNSSKNDSVVDMIDNNVPAAPAQTSVPAANAAPAAPVVPVAPSDVKTAEVPETPVTAPVTPTTNTTN